MHQDREHPILGNVTTVQDGSVNEQSLNRAAVLAFAPLDKRALGVALGVAAGLCVFLVTAIYLIRDPDPGFALHLLSQYFYGYSVTWVGAVVGALWGFAVGFVGGWFVAFTRNLVLAFSLFAARTRAELDATRDFLDHI